ncbi:MAG: type II toxin-antitoxin system RelE/ParE family toxin [Ignavibacteriae bacterium]|nr:type II toxin-antitoxin system RelE/ParE family toxin [Ignavibacteriota bacterium]
MSREKSGVPRIEYTDEFKRNIRGLAKKYRSLRSDVQEVINQIERGEILGDQIPGIGYAVFKVRVRNSDIRKGKRSGYRLLYYLKHRDLVILVTLYSKLDQSDVSIREIRRIIKEFEIQHPEFSAKSL